MDQEISDRARATEYSKDYLCGQPFVEVQEAT